VVAAACYAPEEHDCTVECSGVNDCGEGQICGADGYCASPGVAGQCMPSDDHASQMKMLNVVIEGHGKVTVESVGTCASDGAEEGNCTFPVPSGIALQLSAVPNKDREFISWTSTCSGVVKTCTLTPVMAVTQVGAKFE
jgi:hypothetical protein